MQDLKGDLQDYWRNTVVGWCWVNHMPFSLIENLNSAILLFTQAVHFVKPFPKNHVDLHLVYLVILNNNSRFKRLKPPSFQEAIYHIT